MTEIRSPTLKGTLDLMGLKTLEQFGPRHGYGIARPIEQVGRNPTCTQFPPRSIEGRSANRDRTHGRTRSPFESDGRHDE